MRLAFLGLAAFLSALPLSAETFPQVSQSNVTLAATYSRAGDFDKTETKRNDGDYRVTFGVSAIRFGNSDLLNILVEKGVEHGGIPEKKGWALVAVWADWESTGSSSYRFFVRKKVSGVYQTKAVPSELLSIELLQPYVSKSIQTQSEQIISGTDQYKAYTRLTLGSDAENGDGKVADEADPAGRSIAASTPLGMIGGSGRYVRPSPTATAFYLPNAAFFTGYAVSDAYESGHSDVVVATLKLAKASAIPSAQYPAFTGTEPSFGPDSTAVMTLR